MFNITMLVRVTNISLLLTILIGCDTGFDSSLTRAQKYFDDGELASSVIELKTFLRDDPNNIRARWLLAEVYFKAENWSYAEKEYGRARLLGIADDSVVPKIAIALLMQQRFSEVLQLDSREISSPESQAIIAMSRVLANGELGDIGRANAGIEEAMLLAPSSIWAKWMHAKFLLSFGSTAEALQILRDLVVIDPSNGLAWSLLGKAHVLAAQYDLAEKSFSNSIIYRQFKVQGFFDRGVVRVYLGNLEGAMEDALALIKLAPNWSSSSYLMSLVKFNERHYVEAAELAEQAYSKDPRNPSVVLLLASSQFKANNINRALEMAERAYSLESESRLTRNLYAMVLLRVGKAETAESILRPFVDMHPEYLTENKLLAASFILGGKIDEAAAILTNIARKQQGSADAQVAAGAALLATGNVNEAVESIRSALSLSSGNKQRVAQLGTEALIEADARGYAVEIAKAYADGASNLSHANRLLGLAYLSDGQLESARVEFLKVIDSNPGDSEARQYLAGLSLKAGEPDAAQRHLEIAIESGAKDYVLFYRLAAIKLLGGKMVEARGLLEKSMSLAPTAAAPRVALAALLLSSNEPESALSILMPISRYPEISVQLAIADAYAALGRFERARVVLEQLSVDGEYAQIVNWKLANVYHGIGDQAGVEMSLKRAVDVAPNTRLGRMALIQLLVLERNYSDAKARLDTMKDGGLGVLRLRLAVENGIGNEKAVSNIARKIFDREQNAANLIVYAQAASNVGESEVAIGLMRDWIRISPQDLSVTLVLADMLYKSGEAEEARKLLQDVSESHREDPRIWNNLAWYVMNSDPTTAVLYSKKAIGIAGTPSVAMWDTYAEALARTGESKLALSTIDQAVRSDGGSLSMRLRKVEIAILAREYATAEAELKTLLGEELPTKSREKARALMDSLPGGLWRRRYPPAE